MAGNSSKKPYALLVFGAPCSGKTTFATEFSKQFNAVYLDFSKLKIGQEGALEIVDQVTKSPQTTLIEGCLNTEKDREEVVAALRKNGYRPILVWVQTETATLKKRLTKKLKSPSAAKSAYESAVAVLEAPSDSESPVVLSGKHTFAAQRATVLAHLSNDFK